MSRFLLRFLFVFLFIGINICSAQMGLYGNIYLAGSQSLAIKNAPFYFFNGIAQSDRDTAALVFLGSAQALNASQQSHSEIKTLITAQENFIFPLGQQGRYLPLGLQQGSTVGLEVQLILGPPSFQMLNGEIEQLFPFHHWRIQGDKFAQVQLSWDQATDLNNSLEDLDDLLFLGFNGNQWEIIPASIANNLINGNTPSSLTAGSLISDNSIDLGLYEALALPKIAALQSQLAARGIQLLSISLDREEALFRETARPYPWTHYCDLQGWDSPNVKAYRVFATPSFFLVNPDQTLEREFISTAQIKTCLSL